MHDIVVARALHVLAVVIWIGGVSMATTVVLPAVRRRDLGPDPLSAFEAIERRFAWLHRAHWILLGLSLVTIVAAVAGSRGWSLF